MIYYLCLFSKAQVFNSDDHILWILDVFSPGTTNSSPDRHTPSLIFEVLCAHAEAQATTYFPFVFQVGASQPQYFFVLNCFSSLMSTSNSRKYRKWIKVAIAAAFCPRSLKKQLTPAVSINRLSKSRDCVYHHKSKATEVLLTLTTAIAFKISFLDQSGLQQLFSVKVSAPPEFHHSLLELSIFLSAKLFKNKMKKIVSSDWLTVICTH